MPGWSRSRWDALLERLVPEGLVKAGGRQRTDSTHVIAAVAALNRLELAGESVRAALEALAAAHPAWVEQRICVKGDFTRRYGTPMTSWRPPVSQSRRDELAIAYARDGYALLEAVYDSSAPAWLRELPAIETRRAGAAVDGHPEYHRRQGGDQAAGEKSLRATVSRAAICGSPHPMTPTPGGRQARGVLAGLQAARHRDL